MIDATLEARLSGIEARMARIERRLSETSAAPAVEPESRVSWQHGRRPEFWSDVEVRRHVINRHRQMTLAELRTEMLALFGPARTPSKSAIWRVWKHMETRARRAA